MQMMLEQPRYVVNRVTAGDYDCPRKVMNFLTDLHAAFRMLNLRNDFLRKKFDSKSTSFQIVYNVYRAKCEMVMNIMVFDRYEV